MIAPVFIDEVEIGQVNFSIIAEAMGVIGGYLIPNENYLKFQPTIRKHYELKGISNIHDFNFRIIFNQNYELKPEGGIGITDSEMFDDEIFVESAGLDLTLLRKYFE